MENLIKNNNDKFMTELPAGHQERFEMKIQSHKIANKDTSMFPAIEHNNTSSQRRRRLQIGILSTAAAILLIIVFINKDNFTTPYLYHENEKVAEMRMLYETQIYETIELLESVLANVDDSTRKEINIIIENLNHTSDAFADIAPLPEEKQLAITSYIYNNQLESLNSIYRKINNK